MTASLTLMPALLSKIGGRVKPAANGHRGGPRVPSSTRPRLTGPVRHERNGGAKVPLATAGARRTGLRRRLKRLLTATT